MMIAMVDLQILLEINTLGVVTSLSQTMIKLLITFIYILQNKMQPEVINSSDMIEILNQDDLEFTRESRPIDYFYAVEKSMYQTISDEMLRMFATIADFNNLDW
jgi:hypothetical protein